MCRQSQDAARRVTTYSLELINDPSFNLIREFIKGDVFLVFIIRLTVYFNVITGELACKLDIKPAFSDSKRNLAGLEIDLRFFVSLHKPD